MKKKTKARYGSAGWRSLTAGRDDFGEQSHVFGRRRISRQFAETVGSLEKEDHRG